MANRVEIATASLESLQSRTSKESEKHHRDREYIAAFRELINVLHKIKKDIELITKFRSFKKYVKAIYIKERLIYLTGKYETALKDLQFTLIIANEERRRNETEALTEDLAEFDKFFETVGAKVDYISKQIMNNIKTDIKDLVTEEWIKMKIKEKDINYFEYSEFNIIKEICKEGFGVVKRAETSDKKQVALKCLTEKKSSEIDVKVIENFIKELKTLRAVGYHDNIINFLGISKDRIGYVMVLEYANEGNLRDYLTKKFKSLEWEKKIRMTLDITCGLRCLHFKGIIHRDLHSKNILVNNSKLLIANFGLSTEVTSNSTSNKMGVIEYADPQCLKNENHVKDKKSDVYSLEPVEGTPSEYQQLYQKCWDDDPKKRPDIDQVYKEISRQCNSNCTNEQEDSLAASVILNTILQ
ncbi:hypothetical protein RclHR1_10120001 [Rhizophagus clarus]|uniref:Protein kinase domain-containing protein n=1 Tax=Rhizophagus clarus TaxID=94130 RepID=A0A2Z6QF58_9GLOM|nr:hypothetical protein RclHR1_10120001 [Rhizophagus clarus]